MRISLLAAAAKIAAMILLAQGHAAAAAEVKVLSVAAMSAVLKELGPQFERATGHKLVMQFDVIPVMKRKNRRRRGV